MSGAAAPTTMPGQQRELHVRAVERPGQRPRHPRQARPSGELLEPQRQVVAVHAEAHPGGGEVAATGVSLGIHADDLPLWLEELDLSESGDAGDAVAAALAVRPPYMQLALVAGIVVGATAPLIGVFLVQKGLSLSATASATWRSPASAPACCSGRRPSGPRSSSR